MIYSILISWNAELRLSVGLLDINLMWQRGGELIHILTFWGRLIQFLTIDNSNNVDFIILTPVRHSSWQYGKSWLGWFWCQKQTCWILYKQLSEKHTSVGIGQCIEPQAFSNFPKVVFWFIWISSDNQEVLGDGLYVSQQRSPFGPGVPNQIF